MLVGAVHIADKAYFTALNQRFKGYDAVLYELVGGPMPKEGNLSDRPEDPKLAWIASMHQRLKNSLALSSQLHEIDYRAANFVHADMTLEQFHAARRRAKQLPRPALQGHGRASHGSMAQAAPAW